MLALIATSGASGGAQEGRIDEVRLRSPSLEANRLGDSAERRVLVYVPAGYDRTPDRSYPVVYLLHGYGAGPASWVGEDGYEDMDIRVVLDSLTRTGSIEDMLVVMPDARTRLGGSWYVNSPVSGSWEDFIARDLVAEIDRRYRTIPDRHARGIAGQSMGGYGALWIALRHREVFGVLLAMSPVNVERPNPFGAAGAEAALAADSRALDRASPLARLLWSKAVAFSPDPERAAPGAVLPYRIAGDSVELVEAVWERWLEGTLQRAVEVRGAALKGVQVQLEVGEADPVAPEVARLSAALSRAGVQHTYRVFEGGHVAGVRARFERSVFQFFSAHFTRDRGGEGSLEDLEWMGGCWESVDGDLVLEEHWLRPRGGLMLGLSRTVRAGRAVGYEYMRIVERDGVVVLGAEPAGQAPTEFRSVVLADSVAIFENPEHDFPQRIIYRPAADSLWARIEGESDGRVGGVDFRMGRVRCDGPER